jgi:hypothetical protein
MTDWSLSGLLSGLHDEIQGAGRSAALDCELCSPERPEASLRDVRRYGSWSMSPRASLIALKSCSVGRDTASGMIASRRFTKMSSFPAQWAAAHRPARWFHDRHSDYCSCPPHRSQVHGVFAIAGG